MSTGTSGIGAKLSAMSPRERTLLVVLGCVLGSGALFLAVWTSWGALSELNEGNDARREAMLQLLAQRDTFAAAAAERAELEEKLTDNDLRLSSFIETAATRAGMPAPREFEDRQSPREGGIVAVETTATFDGIELADFDRLLNDLRSSDELVYIQSVSIEPGRGRNSDSMSGEITLATYRRQQGGDRD